MRALLLAFTLFAGATAAAQPKAATPSSFSAAATPSSVRLGQPFVYEVVVTDDAAVRYELPRELRLGTLAVRGVELQRREEGGEAVTTARIELAIYDELGQVQLPDLVLTARDATGATHLTVPGAPITVEALAEGEELDGLRQQQELRIFSVLPLWIAAGALLAAALGVLAVRTLRRRAPAPAVSPSRSPEDRALDALAALEAAGAADGRAWYFALSEIVRGFLEEVSGLRAREMTTSELVDALVAREVPGLSLAQLGSWLERGDLHRFARAEVSPESAAADLEKARQIVRGVAAALRPPAEEAA